MHLCKCSCSIAQSKSNNICTLPSQTICIIKDCAMCICVSFTSPVCSVYSEPSQLTANWRLPVISSESDFVTKWGFGHDGYRDSKIFFRPPSRPIWFSWFAVSLFMVSCRGPVYATTLFQQLVVKLQWNSGYYFCRNLNEDWRQHQWSRLHFSFSSRSTDILLQARHRNLQSTIFIGNSDILMQYSNILRSILT